MKVELNATIFGRSFKDEATDVDYVLVYPGEIKVVYNERNDVSKSNTIKFRGKIPQYFKIIEDGNFCEKLTTKHKLVLDGLILSHNRNHSRDYLDDFIGNMIKILEEE